MRKTVYPCVDLKVITNGDYLLSDGELRQGLLEKQDDDTFVFQETVVNESRRKRNPKIFEGTCLSLVRKQDGSYQFHARCLSFDGRVNRRKLAQMFYHEMIDALSMIV